MLINTKMLRGVLIILVAFALVAWPISPRVRDTQALASEKPLEVIKKDDYLTVGGHTFRVIGTGHGTAVLISAHMPVLTFDIAADSAVNAAAVAEGVAAFEGLFAADKAFISRFGIPGGDSGGVDGITFGGVALPIPETLADKKIAFKDALVSNSYGYGYIYGGKLYAAGNFPALHLLIGGTADLNAAGYGITGGVGTKADPYIIGRVAAAEDGAEQSVKHGGVISSALKQPFVDYSEYNTVTHLWLNTSRGVTSVLSGVDYRNYFASGVFNPSERGVIVRLQTDAPLTYTALKLPEHVKFNQVSLVSAMDVVDEKGRPVDLSGNLAVDKNTDGKNNIVVSDSEVTFRGLDIDTNLRASVELLIILSVQAGYEGDIYLTAENRPWENIVTTKVATAKKAVDIYTRERWKSVSEEERFDVEAALGRPVVWNGDKDVIIIENEPGVLKTGSQISVMLDTGLSFKGGFKTETTKGLKLKDVKAANGAITATVHASSLNKAGAVLFTGIVVDKNLSAELGWHGIYLAGEAVAENVGNGPGQFEYGAVYAPYFKVLPRG